jgi:DNA invertase Pin-like site-specific DNA recombinase
LNTYNYIRVSTESQNTERQLQGIDYDVEFLEKVSGKDSNREQLTLMLRILKTGDLVNVHSLDRLARNTQDLLKIVDEIITKGASVKFHKENLMFDGNDKNPMNELMLTMLGAFAQFERSIMLERQREGIAIAKAKGKYKGRKSSLTNEQMQEMKVDFNNGMKKTEIAEKYGVTRSYVYQLVKKNHHGLRVKF